MALQARFKPVFLDTVSVGPDGPGQVPAVWRILCGYPICRGRLGFLYHGLQSADGITLDLPVGYVQAEPNVWRLGRHAAKRHDHSPRRMRYSVRSSAEHAYRTRDGEVILPDGRPLSQEVATRYYTPGFQGENVALGTRLTIECSRCHAPSQFVVLPSPDLLEEVRRRKHNGPA